MLGRLPVGPGALRGEPRRDVGRERPGRAARPKPSRSTTASAELREELAARTATSRSARASPTRGRAGSRRPARCARRCRSVSIVYVVPPRATSKSAEEEVRIGLEREREHREAVVGRGGRRRRLVRRVIRGHVEDAVEPQPRARLLDGHEVPEVDRVERPAVDADPDRHGSSAAAGAGCRRARRGGRRGARRGARAPGAPPPRSRRTRGRASSRHVRRP